MGTLYLIFRQMIKFTFIDWVLSKTAEKHYELGYVKAFWDLFRKEFSDEIKESKKIILVECLEKANPSWNSYYILPPLLSKKHEVKIIALTNYSSNKGTVGFLRNYAKVDFVESVYKPLDFLTKAKVLIYMFSNFPFKYSMENGISVKVEGVDIGDLIYDEYLRVAKKETLRRVSFLYLFMVFNSIYGFLRYKKIIQKHGVTDIVAIRDTYSHSSFYRALPNLTIWKNRSGIMSSIRKLKTNLDYNHKPFYFEKKHREFLREKYKPEYVETKYQDILLKRKNGDVKTGDSREIKLAHNGNDILTIEDFNNIYKRDEDKKNIVIYAHVFVDAVRYPHSVIFSDHYTWLVETLKFLVGLDKYNIMVKPHPSESLYNLGKTITSVVRDWNQKLGSNIIILDQKIDFQVIKSIADTIVTGSGTIAIEAPCEGIKVITCGSNSYENTEAMFRCKTKDSYFELLSNIEKLPEVSFEQKINSKLGFIWLNDEMYVESDLCMYFEKFSKSKKDFQNLDLHYKDMDIESTFGLLERIDDDRIN